jgi:hypothetical protein
MESNWTATHNHLPGPDGTPNLIRVTGTVTVPTQNSTAKLVRQADGINPKIMMLRVMITTPDNDLDVINHVEVEYTETNSHEYDSVDIVGDASASIEMQHVH